MALRRSSLFALSLVTLVALSASATPLESRGVAGEPDRHGRSPLLVVSSEERSDGVQLLVDVTQEHSEIKKFPITVEFYVNRNLVATQLRSPELPGPLGVTVTPEMATVPFNYAVVATVVYPNRSFSSVIQGAVEKRDLSTVFARCAFTLDERVIEAETVQVAQSSAGRVVFSGINTDQEEFTAELSVDSGGTVKGVVVTDAVGEDKVTYNVSGLAAFTGQRLKTVDVGNEESELTLACE